MHTQPEEFVVVQPFGIAGVSRELTRLELAKESLRSFGELRIAAVGASMVPSIFPGDVLTVQRENRQRARCGDVVLTSRDNRFFAHRVVGKSQFCGTVSLITRGDALPASDPPVAEEEILGRVISIERGKRKLGVRPRLSCFERSIQWAVRRSDIVLKFVLHAHLVRRNWMFATQGTAKAS